MEEARTRVSVFSAVAAVAVVTLMAGLALAIPAVASQMSDNEAFVATEDMIVISEGGEFRTYTGDDLANFDLDGRESFEVIIDEDMLAEKSDSIGVCIDEGGVISFLEGDEDGVLVFMESNDGASGSVIIERP